MAGVIAVRRAVCGLVLLFAAASPLRAEPALTFATEGTYPPWSIVDAAGTLAGFDVELIGALCRVAERDCTLEQAVFPAMIDQLVEGRFDGIVSGIAITAEREKTIAFTRPYMSLSVSFAVPAGSRLAANAPDTREQLLAALAHARLGAQADTVNAGFIAEVLPEATLVTFGDQESLNAAIARGTVDAGLAATETWLDPAPEIARSIVALRPPLTSVAYPILGRGLGIGLRKADGALKAALDDAICALVADGTIALLSVRWFRVDLSVPCAGGG
ncbi:MAG: transporter substrate-binding domain-containing protein [Bauldia sp.]|nr:transporter substrate-binding domain-containing protein [Bauldia sp.]